MHILIEQIHVEVIKPPVLVLECKEWFPTQAVIDGETLCRFPRVLHVDADILLPVIQVGLHVALCPANGLPD